MGLYDSLMRVGTEKAKEMATRCAALIRYEMTMVDMEMRFNQKKGETLQQLPERAAESVKVEATETGSKIVLDCELTDEERELAEQCFANAKKKLKVK